MNNTYFEGMHFVEVRHGTSRELWVTAGPRKEAVANVLKHFSRGHIAELSDRRLTAEEASHLKLRNGEACVYEPVVGLTTVKPKRSASELSQMIMREIQKHPECAHIANVAISRLNQTGKHRPTWGFTWNIKGNSTAPAEAVKIVEKLQAQFDLA